MSRTTRKKRIRAGGAFSDYVCKCEYCIAGKLHKHARARTPRDPGGSETEEICDNFSTKDQEEIMNCSDTKYVND